MSDDLRDPDPSEPVLTAAQMRAWEEAAMAAGEATGLDLMERAGRGAVEAILARWLEFAEGTHRAVVLCGPGNNGGDGFVVARLLAARGWEVRAFLYGDATRMGPDARANYDRWAAAHPVAHLSAPVPTEEERAALETVAAPFAPDRRWADVVVDALFGIGLTRPITDLLPALDDANLTGEAGDDDPPRLVALDVPSGLCADSGRVLGEDEMHAFGAHLTVAFGALKGAHVLAEGPALCGHVRIVDLRLSPEAYRRGLAEERGVTEPPFLVGRWAAHTIGFEGLHSDTFQKRGHKYENGHALVLTGGFGRTGAARLAARAALRIGAGVVTLAAPGAAMMECAMQTTAVMLRRCEDADALRAMLADARIGVLCLGPGLGTGPREADIVRAAIDAARPPQGSGPRSRRGRPLGGFDGSFAGVVLDADALTLIARERMLGRLHENCVLTPHMGEFARLCPDLAAHLDGRAEAGPAYGRIDAARDAADRLDCTVLLKGPDTVIARPDGSARVNTALRGRAVPWLATAGAGDVLAGMIAGLLARGLSPSHAAESAAWLHVECARAFGPGLVAEDLPETLPRVLADLGA